MPNKIIPYNPKLKILAQKLRKQGILSEVLLWKELQRKRFGVEFHRQVPMLDYIVDFYCHELMLVIEIDGISHDMDGAMIKDENRQNALEAYGVVFLRFRDEDVRKDMRNVRLVIEMKIKEVKNKN